MILAKATEAGDVVNMLLATEVERVFVLRGWSSYDQAARITHVPPSTIRRMRKGNFVKPDTAARFGVSVGESAEKWRKIAAGIQDGSGETQVREVSDTEYVPPQNSPADEEVQIPPHAVILPDGGWYVPPKNMTELQRVVLENALRTIREMKEKERPEA